MPPQPSATTIANVTCPFCGLACDDLSISIAGGLIESRTLKCPLAERGFAAGEPATPRVRGKDVSLERAVGEAAALLSRAQSPVIGGLGADMAGARALLALADRCRAVVDHMNSRSKLRNLLVLQDGGWITTTLSEVRNRADLIVLAGTGVVSRFPRFFERCVWNPESMFSRGAPKREVVYLGRGLDVSAGIAPDGTTPQVIECEVARLGDAFSVLRALIAKQPLQCAEAAGVSLEAWGALLEKMKAATYGVVVWAAPDLDFPNADLAVQSLCELIKDLNRHTRFSGMPLGGSDGDFTANGVQMWQTGFPIRSRYARDGLDYDPYHLSAERMLAAGEADALLWVSSYDERRVPPETDVPTIVLGRAGMKLPREPEVLIPVGTPGLDHAGHFFRSDKVVALPLRQLREPIAPSVEQVATAIAAALPA